MAKVLHQFKVARMNDILQQFRVHRPTGVKREGKASLIVKNVPRDQLLKLLEDSVPTAVSANATPLRSNPQRDSGQRVAKQMTLADMYDKHVKGNHESSTASPSSFSSFIGSTSTIGFPCTSSHEDEEMTAPDEEEDVVGGNLPAKRPR